MNKDDYIKISNEKLVGNSKNIMVNQIENYYLAKECNTQNNKYQIGEKVLLKKGTLLHGTYKNLEGLKEIIKDGLISSWFIDGRLSKYPSSVGVWNLKQDYLLNEYINFYSGTTIMWNGIYIDGKDTQENKTEVIPYDRFEDLKEEIYKNESHMWTMEQTKEARFMPSLVQDRVQIGIIFNGDLARKYNLTKGDILDDSFINDEDVKPFVNDRYYERFLVDRKNKDDFFTDRESAILFGIPANLIEGILVGRNYEKNENILNEIKSMLPNCYICNLDGTVIA